MLCIDVDLSSLKFAEKERRKLSDQLQQSQKMEAIGVLAGGIAHDFNNLLTVIIGNAELTVDRSPLDSPMRNEVGQIIQAGLCAKDLVGQILDFSRQKEIDAVPLLPGLVVKEALQLIRATLPPQIVKSYGGFIPCKSKLGKGSVFNINLPAIAQYNEKEDIVRDDVSPNGCERLLFVDDEEMLGEMAKTILEKLGYDVSIRSCPIEALKLFEKQPEMSDMLIKDLSMPGMDGIELTKKMLAIRSDLPVMPVYWEQ